jgi:hypothetical protein
MSRRPARLWLLATLVAGGVYLGLYLNRGWYPHDEGALGQAAERVLAGEVPHRDFDEPYTGLLTYLHAAAFAVGGIRLPVLRIPLFLVTLAWLAALFRIAARSTGPPGAALVALVALAWSVPNYPASMPSWYNLFFATFGVLFLFRWSETGASRWLVLAGLTGGVSFLFKLSGLFYVTGAALFLLYATRAPEHATRPLESEPVRPDPGARLVGAGVAIAMLLLVLMLWRSVAPLHWFRVIYHFVLPGTLLALALAAREWVPPYQRGSTRIRSLVGVGAPFAAGVLIPVLLFAGGFALADALPAVINGVFVAPFRRLAFANMRPPASFWVLAAVPLVILLRPRPEPSRRRWKIAGAIMALLLSAVLWLASAESFPHRFVWQSLRGLIPLVAAVAVLVMVWPRAREAWVPGGVTRFVLLAMVTAFASLIQFPFSAPIYFLYVAPLLLLSLVALVQGIGRTPPPLSAATLGFYGAFAVLLVTPGAMVGMGFRAESNHPNVTLELPRGGLRIKPDDAALYGALIPELVSRAEGGSIWAGPDAPEVYFLGGFRNRSRALFDFLGDARTQGRKDSTGSEAAVFLRSLEGVTAIVINGNPNFSSPLPADLIDSLRARFPEGHAVERFELRWRR